MSFPNKILYVLLILQVAGLQPSLGEGFIFKVTAYMARTSMKHPPRGSDSVKMPT